MQTVTHNTMHAYFIEREGNQIQRYLLEFIDDVEDTITLKENKIFGLSTGER